jgi:spermidine synthase
MAGLIYEVVWVRELTSRLGAGIYAVSAVLAAFMGGLALGAVLAGRLADRLRNPLLVYATLELLIAGTAWALPAVWGLVEQVDAGAYAVLGDSPVALAAARFGAAAAVLLLPTTLMGATLPCLSHAIVAPGNATGGRVGGLYAANTLGAVAGSLLSGFWLVEFLGVSATAHAAAALNLAAGVGALWLWGVVRPEPAGPAKIHGTPPAVPSPASRTVGEFAPTVPPRSDDGCATSAAVFRLVLAGAFLTGFVALAAEILWSRSLVFVFDEPLKNTTYCFSAMLSVFLAGLGLGSALSARFIDKARSPSRLYGWLLALQAAAMALSVVVLDLLRFRPAASAPAELVAMVAVNVGRTVAVLGLPTLLMGMTFPVAVGIATTPDDVARRVGGLYGVNTLGSVVATVAAPFLIVPCIGVAQGLVVLAAMLASLAVIVVAQTGDRPVRWAALVALAGFVPAVGVDHARQHKGVIPLVAGESLLHIEESAVATVTVIENERGERRVCVDDVPVAGTSRVMQTDQKSLAHLGMALCRAPRTVLTVGFGSGGASYSFLQHGSLERVDCVEICPAIVRAAPFLTAANHDFLEKQDPRYRLIFEDARAFLRCTTLPYDVISTDCTDLRYKSSANLYDFEYFDLCRRRLNSGGLVVVWMPLGGLSDHMFRTSLRTFHRVFPEMAVFYLHNEWTHYILLVGWRERAAIDFGRVAAVLSQPEVHQDLLEIGMSDPYKLVATFVTAGQPLADYLRGELLNTQDLPVLEFEGPRHLARLRQTVDTNLQTLLDSRASVFDWIEPGTMDDRQRERLRRYIRAFLPILAAQRAELDLDLERATRLYLQALAATPEDQTLREALEFPKFVPLAEQGNPTVWLLLGRSRQLQNRHREALEDFARYFAGCDRLAAGDGGISDAHVREATRRQARAWHTQAMQWQQVSQMEAAREEPARE